VIPKTIHTGVGWVWLARLSFQHILEGGLIIFMNLQEKEFSTAVYPSRPPKIIRGRNKVLELQLG